MNPIKTTGLFLIVILPLFLNGQNSESRISNKLSIGVNFSPDYTFRHLRMENDEHSMIDLRNEIEEPMSGFTTGLVTHYQLSNKLALESGIHFSDKGYKDEGTIEDFVTLYGISPENDPSLPENYLTRYNYYYLGIPLKLNYYFLQKRITLFISGGVSTDFFLSGKSKYVNEFKDRTERGSYDMDEDFNKVNFVGLASLGIEKDISTKLRLRFEPTFRYSFTPVVDAPMKEYLYSFGANVVLFCKF